MKTLTLLILLLLFAFVSCSSAESETMSNQKNMSVNQTTLEENKLRILAFGDSLTEGYGVKENESYPYKLEQELQNLEFTSVEVINSGLSGETSASALNRVEWSMRADPDIIIIGIGANDAMRGIDLALTKQNILDIISYFEEQEVKVILSGQQIYENLGFNYTKNFRELYFEIAQETNVSFIPFFLEGVALNESLNIEDNIHPNKEGYELIVKENILPVLVPVVKQELNKRSSN